ncbi:MFS transporter [Duganella sp. Root336D2]|uniref:MFS transporter n=1 Tax=Duganella sp. Root336D2 TaxID=1736518 RepID=UPI0006F7DE1C|nr:MFS transporter [Duganella sp. Root336D2]KQV43050.1 MFS transporter [Duganella sp. Root336D2]
MDRAQQRSPWGWVPTLYFNQGIPYFAVMALTTAMYKDLGISNADMAYYTAWLYLPWVIKPLWSPLIEMFGTKRAWTTILQMVLGVSLASVAFTLPLSNFFQLSLGVMWLMAFSSATHDIAADGYYMLALRQKQQAEFVGVRSTFYRAATVACQGGVLFLAGNVIKHTGNPQMAWSVAFAVLGAVFLALALYHLFALPKPADDARAVRSSAPMKEFFATFAAFFRKDGIIVILLFLLLFRLGESQLLKMVVPFLKDPLANGGLGLSTEAVGIAYGTVGIIGLILGGLAGGWLIARFGLKRCLWPFAIAIHIPDLIFVYLSQAQPQNFAWISACLAVEQFGYGLGFTSFMMYMIMVSQGEHKTAHYSICTGFMALGMMIPQMASGKLQELLGYQHFFIFACMATIPAFIMTALIKIDPDFGRE